MPRKKKSRKVGQIGIPKSSTNTRKAKPVEKRVKKHLGKPAGSRNSEAKLVKATGEANSPKDPRHGSKKPIDLFAADTKTVVSEPKVKHFSPAQELDAIENNQQLSDLLNKIELGKKVSKEEQHFVDKNLARHKVLCELLGLNEEPEESTEFEENPIDSYEAINIDDYKD
ncbi:Der GTPase-activating protein YihI [Paraglaciecola aquimarina]|uniref:Der GTPase-activating protein YihI n=1 Tax=Paraglaciecola aquimarina TaxID=1235557 RepID=A0ABU3STP0_9ALTE|nr:Der GTPase-activating protein YihI [Paraglaciecola aquimarina]MDU0353364.1 Der GTPase-activating protein YihI [Paraglaciecola aquimarina]